MSVEPWPSSAFDAAIFRGLDARGRRELEASGHLRKLGAGDRVFHEGDRGAALFVVVDGKVIVTGTARGDDHKLELRRVVS
ncbi:MAG: cyclic nucleotide-binding domain-containing protein, partial [Myxococcales bacterium]|nr:cyclic nucleotide-binding domain-containing protein [Myxococcales bacterium]